MTERFWEGEHQQRLKSELRTPKSETNSKFEFAKPNARRASVVSLLDLIIGICFGFRISDFGFSSSASADARFVLRVGFKCGHNGFFAAETRILHALHGLEHAFVIFRHHF